MRKTTTALLAACLVASAPAGAQQYDRIKPILRQPGTGACLPPGVPREGYLNGSPQGIARPRSWPEATFGPSPETPQNGPYPNVGTQPVQGGLAAGTGAERQDPAGQAPPLGPGPYPGAGQWAGPCQGVYPMHYGVVRSISQWHLRLTDGRSVDLHDYTVIQPTGGTIRKGMRIGIHGFFEPGHAIGKPTLDAREIVIVNGDGADH